MNHPFSRSPSSQQRSFWVYLGALVLLISSGPQKVVAASLQEPSLQQPPVLTAAFQRAPIFQRAPELWKKPAAQEGKSIDDASIAEAARRGHLDVLRELLELGGNPNARGGGYGNSALALAATIGQGDREAVIRLLVGSGAEVNASNGLGETALHRVARDEADSSGPILQLLLELGAQVDAKDERGWTPLLVALDSGNEPATAALLEAGANANVVTPGGRTPWSVLAHAAATYTPVAEAREDLEALLRGAKAKPQILQAELRQQLIRQVVEGDLDGVLRSLEEGADPDSAKDDEDPVLYLSVRRGHLEIAEALLQGGASPDAVALGDQQTALSLAIQKDDLESTRRLFSHSASPQVLGRYQRRVRLPLAGIRDPEIFPVLLAGGVEPHLVHQAKLVHAARFGDRQSLRDLLARSRNLAPAGQELEEGWRLDVSEVTETPLLFVAIAAGQTEVIQELLERGANVEARASDSTTPLMWAASGGRLDILRKLLEAGADPNEQNTPQDPALAISIRNGYPQLAEELLRAGADARQLGTGGDSVLHLAANRGFTGLVKDLLAAGADLNAKDHLGRTPLMVAAANNHSETEAFLLEVGADPQGLPQIHLLTACRRGDFTAAAASLEQKADPNVRFDDCTALGLAAVSQHREVSQDGKVSQGEALARRIELVELLLEAGGDPNLPCHLFPPIVTAAERGQLELVEILLAAGANIDADGGYRESVTALRAAAQGGHEEVVAYLLAKGAAAFWSHPSELSELGLDDGIRHLLEDAF